MTQIPYKIGDTLTLINGDDEGWIADGDHKVVGITEYGSPVVGTRTAINPVRIAAINGVAYKHPE